MLISVRIPWTVFCSLYLYASWKTVYDYSDRIQHLNTPSLSIISTNNVQSRQRFRLWKWKISGVQLQYWIRWVCSSVSTLRLNVFFKAHYHRKKRMWAYFGKCCTHRVGVTKHVVKTVWCMALFFGTYVPSTGYGVITTLRPTKHLHNDIIVTILPMRLYAKYWQFVLYGRACGVWFKTRRESRIIFGEEVISYYEHNYIYIYYDRTKYLSQ